MDNNMTYRKQIKSIFLMIFLFSTSSMAGFEELSLINKGKAIMQKQKKVLVINASPNLQSSSTRMLSKHFTDSLSKRFPNQYSFQQRDIGRSHIPFIQDKSLEVFSNGTAKSPQSKLLMLASDRFIKEFQSADSIVIATPVHNFSTPASLKAYFDLVLRAGKTFSFTSEGPKGLLKDRPLLLISSAGGEYAGSQFDFLTPYVRQVASFVGIQNFHVVAAEGLALKGRKESSLLEARQKLESFVDTFHFNQL